MMKFALFLVCALVAVQGFQARSVKSNDRALSDIIDKIKAVIEKIKQVIGEITSQIPELIQNIKDIIKEIPDLANEIQQKIEKIIQDAGEIDLKCIAAEHANIDALIHLAHYGLQGCSAEAYSKANALKKQVEVFVNKADALRDDVLNRVLKCVDENILNPIALANCLKDQVESISEEVAGLQKEVVNIIAYAKETSKEILVTFVECFVKLKEEIAGKEQEISENIRECIKENTD